MTHPKPTNCLAGWRCPGCGYDESFEVEARCWVTVTDDGTDDARSFDWEPDSQAVCGRCGRRATIGTFNPELS